MELSKFPDKWDEIEAFALRAKYSRRSRALKDKRVLEALSALEVELDRADAELDAKDVRDGRACEFDNSIRMAATRQLDLSTKYIGQPMVVGMQERKRKASDSSSVRRMLSFDAEIMSRYIWRLDTCGPAPTSDVYCDAIPEEGVDPLTDWDGYMREWELVTADERYLKVGRLMTIRTARGLQKKCKECLIPVRLEVAHNALYWAYGAGSISTAEQEWFLLQIQAAAHASGGRYVQTGMGSGIHWGFVYRAASHSKLRALYGDVYL